MNRTKYVAYCVECYLEVYHKKGMKIQLTPHDINDDCLDCLARHK